MERLYQRSDGTTDTNRSRAGHLSIVEDSTPTGRYPAFLYLCSAYADLIGSLTYIRKTDNKQYIVLFLILDIRYLFFNYKYEVNVLERAPPFCLTINNKYNIIFMSWGNPVNFGENSPALRRGRAICFNRSFF